MLTELLGVCKASCHVGAGTKVGERQSLILSAGRHGEGAGRVHTGTWPSSRPPAGPSSDLQLFIQGMRQLRTELRWGPWAHRTFLAVLSARGTGKTSFGIRNTASYPFSAFNSCDLMSVTSLFGISVSSSIKWDLKVQSHFTPHRASVTNVCSISFLSSYVFATPQISGLFDALILSFFLRFYKILVTKASFTDSSLYSKYGNKADGEENEGCCLSYCWVREVRFSFLAFLKDVANTN